MAGRARRSRTDSPDRSARRESGRAALLPISYPELPVAERRDEIAAAIRDHQVVIVAGETGSGKTTQLPKICLELGRGVGGLIGHTQPRRIAARTVAERIAEELGRRARRRGRLHGPVHRPGRRRHAGQADDRRHPARRDPARPRRCARYDTIIIDEAHERSLNIDFLLGYLKQLLPRRPDLKVVITSATIDPERFAAALRRRAGGRGVRPHLPGRGALPAGGRPGRDRTPTTTATRSRRSCDAVDELLRRGARRRAGVPVRRARDPRHRRRAARAPAGLREHARSCRCTRGCRPPSSTGSSRRTPGAGSCWPPTSPRPR